MEFVSQFIEIICMIALLAGLAYGIFYCMRHRTKISRWVNNYGAKDNALEKGNRIRELKRKIEDAEADLTDLEAEATPEE